MVTLLYPGWRQILEALRFLSTLSSLETQLMLMLGQQTLSAATDKIELSFNSGNALSQ